VKALIGNDVEGTGRGLNRGPLQEFLWRKLGRKQKATIRKGGVLAEIRTEYLAIQAIFLRQFS
jgi:hypothetical protein